MKALATAVRFMTVLPVPDAWCGDERTMARLTWYTPVVGALVGGCAVAVTLALRPLVPPLVLAVLVAAAYALLSGGLHLDGLADTADGFLSWRPRERVLEIMHDSHIGTMGVLALIFVVGLRVALLTALFESLPQTGPRLPATVFLAPMTGRCLVPLTIALVPYARPQGLGALVWQRSVVRAGAGLVVLGVLGWLTWCGTGLVAAGLAALAVGGFAGWCRRRIGGGTGDTLGAAIELGDLLPLVVIVVAVS